MYPFPQDGPVADPGLRHRRAHTEVVIRDAAGDPMASAEVTVRHVGHEFGFGASAFEFIPLATGALEGDDLELYERVSDLWLEVFNAGTLPFYWGQFEAERGRPATEALRTTARWLRDRGVTLKGHPLVWHTLTAPWLDELTVPEVEAAQRERIRRDVAEFAGLIDTWDAINEVVIMPHFDKYPNGITRLSRELGRIETVRLAFDEARSANPNATLLINDFDLGFGYDALLEGLLAAGVEIDAVGLQTHMHQGYRGEEETLKIIDRFARYGLPIHFTETTLVSGHLMPEHIVDLNDYVVDSWPSTPDGEERQADELTRHVRTLFSHPAVKSFTYWNAWDRDSWLGAPSGIIHADGTPKPAFETLRRLVTEEWRTPEQTLRTDDQGRILVEGWRGRYEATAAGRTTQFTLAP